MLALTNPWESFGFFIPEYVVSVYYFVFYTYWNPGLNYFPPDYAFKLIFIWDLIGILAAYFNIIGANWIFSEVNYASNEGTSWLIMPKAALLLGGGKLNAIPPLNIGTFFALLLASALRIVSNNVLY